MNKESVKDSLRYLMSLWLVVALSLPAGIARADFSSLDSGAKADDLDVNAILAATQVRTSNDNGAPIVEISVTTVETGNEQAMLEAMVENSPRGVVVLENVATGPNAATQPVLEATELVTREQTRGYFSRLKSRVHSFIGRQNEKVTGTVISTTSSSLGAMGAYYLANTSLEHSLYLGGAMLAVATLQATFTKSWNTYLSKGGKAAVWLGEKIAKRFNKTKFNEEYAENIGELAAAITFNIAATAGMLSLTDSFHGLVTAALVGMLGAYDYTVDIAMRRLTARGRVNQQQAYRTIKGRVLVGPVLETLSLAGFGPAQLVMGAIGLTGLYAIFKGESALDTIIRAKGKAVKVRINVAKFGDKLFMLPKDVLNILALSPVQKCNLALQIDGHPQIADDTQ